MSLPTSTRINSPLLKSFHDKNVRIIGKVESVNGDYINFDASGPVKVKSDGQTDYTVGRFYEVVGRVQGDDSVVSMTTVDFGDNISEYHIGAFLA